MENFIVLWPDLLAQFILGGVLLFTFAPSTAGDTSPSVGRQLLCAVLTSLLMLGLSLTIEHYISPLVLQSSIVIQWVLFTLLGHRICRIALGKSMLCQFCFFSIMLGTGLLLENVRSPESGSGEPRTEQEAGSGADGEATTQTIRQIRQALLSHRLPEIRRDVFSAVYGITDPARPEPPAPTPTPFPTPAPTPAPTPTPEPDAPPGFVQPAAGTPAPQHDPTLPPAEPTPIPEPTATPSPTPEPEPPEVIPVVIPGEPEVLDGDASIGADQLGDIVRVKHRSTDPRYAPPEYIISAISIGDRGSFVIMEGRLLREGAVLRTGGQQPRGWKLFRVSEAELFWQPLE